MNESTKFMEEEEKKIRHFGLFGLSSVIYALFYTFCLYKNASGITYPFFTGGTLFYFFSFLKKSGISAKKDSAFYAVSIELLGISTFCTDNKNIILMNKCGIFILFFILFIHNFYQDKLWDIFKYFQAILQTILGSLHSFTRPVTDFKLYRKAEKTKDKNKMSGPAYIMIGLLISLPLLTVVLSLLSSADIVFRSFIKDFAFIDWLSENFIGLTFSILFSFFASYCISAYLEKRSVTGQWAKKAWKEAQIYGDAVAVASSEDKTFSYIPDCSDLDIPEDADYVYICENNTIYGTKFKQLPNTKGHVLVADVSSCFLSEPVDVTKYGIIYGGVQKNIGPAGVVIVIIREDLITEDTLAQTPTMLKYKTHADADSLYNTPPAYGIYICGKVFKWLKKQGGLSAIRAYNEEKAKILYDFLDESKLFKGTVVKEDRSLMNVPFVTGDQELDAKFVAEAKAAGFENLKGHRSLRGRNTPDA